MTIIITISGMILAGLLYLLYVPVYFQIGYNIEKRSLETGFIKMYPFTYQIGRKHKRSKASFRHGDQKGKKEKNKIAATIHFIRLLQNELGTRGRLAVRIYSILRETLGFAVGGGEGQTPNKGSNLGGLAAAAQKLNRWALSLSRKIAYRFCRPKRVDSKV